MAGNYFDKFDAASEPSPAEQAQPNPFDRFDAGGGMRKRSALGEIATGIRAGVVGELPQQVGQAMQWASDPEGNAVSRGIYEAGTGLAERAKERLALPGNTLNPDQHNVVTNALAEGGKMLAPSIAAPLAVGAGLALLPEGAIGAGTALGVSALAGSLPAGMSQAQQTYESVKAAGGTEDAAKAAGWKTGAIESGGETIGTYVGGKFVGAAGKALGKAVAPSVTGAITGATDQAILKPFAKDLVGTALTEVGTEIGQAYSQAVVEKNAGVNVDPLEQAKGVVAPTLGMTALLAPFGLHASYRGANNARAVDTILSDPAAASPEQRKAVVDELYANAKKAGAPDADAWYVGALQDVTSEAPIRREAEQATPPPPPPATDPVTTAVQEELLNKLTPEGTEVSLKDGKAEVVTPGVDGEPVAATVNVEDAIQALVEDKVAPASVSQSVQNESQPSLSPTGEAQQVGATPINAGQVRSSRYGTALSEDEVATLSKPEPTSISPYVLTAQTTDGRVAYQVVDKTGKPLSPWKVFTQEEAGGQPSPSQAAAPQKKFADLYNEGAFDLAARDIVQETKTADDVIAKLDEIFGTVQEAEDAEIGNGVYTPMHDIALDYRADIERAAIERNESEVKRLLAEVRAEQRAYEDRRGSAERGGNVQPESGVPNEGGLDGQRPAQSNQEPGSVERGASVPVAEVQPAGEQTTPAAVQTPAAEPIQVIPQEVDNGQVQGTQAEGVNQDTPSAPKGVTPPKKKGETIIASDGKVEYGIIPAPQPSTGAPGFSMRVRTVGSTEWEAGQGWAPTKEALIKRAIEGTGAAKYILDEHVIHPAVKKGREAKAAKQVAAAQAEAVSRKEAADEAAMQASTRQAFEEKVNAVKLKGKAGTFTIAQNVSGVSERREVEGTVYSGKWGVHKEGKTYFATDLKSGMSINKGSKAEVTKVIKALEAAGTTISFDITDESLSEEDKKKVKGEIAQAAKVVFYTLGNSEEAPLLSRNESDLPDFLTATPPTEEQKQAIAQTAKQVDPSLRYDGFGAGLHFFTPTEGPSAGGTFSIPGEATPEAIAKGLAESQAKFTPLKSEAAYADITAYTSNPQEMAKPLTPLVKLIKDAGLETEVLARMQKTSSKPITSLAAGAVRVGRNTFKNIVQTVVNERQGKVAPSVDTVGPVTAALKKFLGRGFDNLVRRGKLEVVNSVELLPANIKEFLKMVAWHGTPHKVDKFSSSKIGTGEGAQAYGHGLYFAGAREVAQWYREKLSAQQQKGNFELVYNGASFPIGSISEKGKQDAKGAVAFEAAVGDAQVATEVKRRLVLAGGDNQIALNRLAEDLDYQLGRSVDTTYAVNMLRKVAEVIVGTELRPVKGNLYQVELAPQEDEYLLWDKPLSEQSEKVKKALRNLGRFFPQDGDQKARARVQHLDDTAHANQDKVTGKTIYRELGSRDVLGDKAASEYLHYLGIRGIKYLDGPSRSKSEGTHNYVIFDENDITITAIFSKDGSIAGAYDPAAKKVYLVSENMKPEDAEYVMRHEAVHALLREDKPFIKQREKILSDFEALAATDESVQAAFARVPADTPAELRTEEAIAYWTQKAENHKHSLFSRIISAIKAALFRLGIAPGKFTASDMTAIFSQGTKAWSMEGSESSGSMNENQPLFSKSNLDPDAAEATKVQAGIEGKTVLEAAQFLVDNAPTQSYKLVAEKVQATLTRLAADGMKFTMKVAHLGDMVPNALIGSRGMASTKFEKTPSVDIWFNGADVTGKVGASFETVLHELVHAAAHGGTHLGNIRGNENTPTGKAVADLITVTNQIIRHFNARVAAGADQLTEFERRIYSNGNNALQNQHEVLAWTLSNPEMQAYLEGIPLGRKNTLWSKFVTAIRTFLGLSVSADTALSEVLRTGEQILDAPVMQLLETAMTKTGPAMSRQTISMQVESQMVSESVKAGKAKVTQAAQALANPKGKLHDLYVQYAPQWLSVTPLRTLVQTFGKTIPQIGAFANHLNSVVAAKTDIVDRSAVIYDQVEKLAKKTVGLDVFNRAAATASFNRITPWEDKYIQGWVPKTGTKEARLREAQKAWVASNMQKTTGKTYLEAYREAVDAYEALKSEDLKQAYISAVEHISSVRARERNNLLAYIEAVSEESSDDARNELMMKFNASFSNLHGAYWPLSRFGDFILEYTAVDGFRHVEHFITIAERNAVKADLIEGGVDPVTVKEDYKNKSPRGSVVIPQMLIDQLRTAATAKAMQGVNPNDADAVQAVQESVQATINDMNQIWLRWQPETSALKNSVRRKNVKGFSEDMLRGYLAYMQSHATSIAWSEQGKKIEADIKSLSDDITEKKADGKSNTDMERMILNDLRNRVQALRSVSVGSAASWLGKLGTAYYMTSPSIALVQMTQLGVLTLPKLATQFGFGKASAALAGGTKDAFSKKFTRDAMFDDVQVEHIFENMGAVVTEENRSLPAARGKELGERLYTQAQLLNQMKDLTPYQVQLLTLRESMARNLLDISAAHEAYELTRGKNPKSLRNKIFKYAMLPMSLSELTSRKAAILATLNLAQDKGQNFFEAMDSVADVVDDTLYSYAKENKGSALQGGFTRVFLQFQHYRIMTGIRLALLFNNSIRGETPEIKKAALKEFVGVLGMSGAFAGTMGLPMAGLLFSCLGMFDDDDDPKDYKLMFTNWLRENFGEKGGEVAAYGLPSLAGTNLSRRIGLGDIYGAQNSPPEGLHGKNLAAWWAASQIGPAFSVGASWVQGYDEMINKGNYMKGLEVATPKPIRDVLKAIRVANDGLKNGQGKKLMSDDRIGPDDIAMLALGFNPSELAAAQSAASSISTMTTRISERRGRLIKDAAQAILEQGDTAKALEAVRTFNSKMPQFAVTGRDIRPAVRKMVKGEAGVTGKRERMVANRLEAPVY